MSKIIAAIRILDWYHIILISILSLMVLTLIASAYSFFKGKKKSSNLNRRKGRKFLIKSYHVFSAFFVTNRYVEQMKKRYEIICPEDIQPLMCKAMGRSYIIWGISISLLIFLFGLNPSVYTAYLSILSIIVLNHEILEYSVFNMNTKLMVQFDNFLSDTRHSFYRHKMIDVAIADASEMSGRIMKVNARKMLNVLDSGDKEGVIRLYNETVSNRFLRMFLSVAVYVAEFGDKIVNGVSVLLINVNILKSDLYIEMMNSKESNYKFSGMIFTTLVPVYLLDGIEKWSKDITPGMVEFYSGTWGIAVRLAVYVSTVIMYIMINELKERNSTGIREYVLLKYISRIRFIHKALNNYEEKQRHKLEHMEKLLYRVNENLTAKQFLLKRIIYGLAIFLAYVIIAISVHKDNQINYLTSSQLLNGDTGVISEKYKEPAAEVVIRYVERYKDKNETVKLEEELKQEGIFRSDIITKCVTDEIIYRVMEYKKEYFHWYELLIAIAAAAVAYSFSYWMLLYRRRVMHLNMGNEVAQFHSTIMMVMYLNNTTVLKVLELMESFASIFKETIKICINDYSSGDMDALIKLKLRERYEPFRRLVDNLIIADKIGIQKAFDEVEEERKVSQEMRNQDYRIARDKKAVIGLIMSFIPAVITVAFYWIIPFALNALGDLREYDSIMKNLNN